MARKAQGLAGNDLAEKITIHGVFLDVHGLGVLLTGASGVGKSECALELITKGHRLIADDVVFINKIGGSSLIAKGSNLIKHHIEIQGIGIIDIQSLYLIIMQLQMFIQERLILNLQDIGNMKSMKLVGQEQ